MEDITENVDESKCEEFKKYIIPKYKDKLFDRSQLNFKSSKILKLKLEAWKSISSLLRLYPAGKFETYLLFFNDCLPLIPPV